MPKSPSRTSRVSTASSTVRRPAKRKPTFDELNPRAIELEAPDAALSSQSVLAIDPGLRGTGFAYFEEGLLVDGGVLDVKPSKNWMDTADRIADKILEEFNPDVLICEMMIYMGGGVAGTGWRGGDMQKTVYLTGVISGAVSVNRTMFAFVPVYRWKGQLPKAVVEKRLRERLTASEQSLAGLKSHAWDAVGIGMWAMGRF